MNISFIHGFNSSSRSFNYIRGALPRHKAIELGYNSHQPLRDSIHEVRQQLPKGDFAIVGHSLGGILAVLLAAEHIEQVTAVVAISAPFAGSKAANTLRWWPGHPKIIEDITPTSSKIELISQLRLIVPTLSIISTSGRLPLTAEPNDSVVTVASQKALKFGKKVEVKANHFEVLMADETVQHLKEFLFRKSYEDHK